MPRPLRIQYPGAMKHVMSRGDRREDIFLGDVDRRDVRKTLAEACQKTGWEVHAQAYRTLVITDATRSLEMSYARNGTQLQKNTAQNRSGCAVWRSGVLARPARPSRPQVNGAQWRAILALTSIPNAKCPFSHRQRQ